MSLAGLRHRVEDADAAEQRCRAAVADRRRLAGLALAAVHRAAEDVGLRTTDGVHRSPEVSGRRRVGDVAELPAEPAVDDPVEALPRELEVVALHVDGPRLVADDVDTALDAADQLVGRGAVRRGLQRD